MPHRLRRLVTWAGLDSWRHYILTLWLWESLLSGKKWWKLHITHRNRMQSCTWGTGKMDKAAAFHSDLQRLPVSKFHICHLAIHCWASYWTSPNLSPCLYNRDDDIIYFVGLSWWLAGIILVKPLALGPAAGGQLRDASSLSQHPLPKLPPSFPTHFSLTCHPTLPQRKKYL